jgi:hypothetical protein
VKYSGLKFHFRDLNIRGIENTSLSIHVLTVTKLCALTWAGQHVFTSPNKFLCPRPSSGSQKSNSFNFYSLTLKMDRLCGLVVRFPGYRMDMYCASCEVRTEFIYAM